MTRRRAGFLALLAVLALAGPAAAAEPDAKSPALEPLVPELAGSPFQLAPGVRPYRHRLSVSPAYGRLGLEPLFALRIAYNPSARLGYEGSLGHNPGESVHGVLHSFGVLVRQPLPGRIQPYVKGGYGMFMVSPGPSLSAKPVTKNALLIGGGVECYLRSDLALRAESQLVTIIGRRSDGDGTAAYRYAMTTIGLAFYRSVGP